MTTINIKPGGVIYPLDPVTGFPMAAACIVTDGAEDVPVVNVMGFAAVVKMNDGEEYAVPPRAQVPRFNPENYLCADGETPFTLRPGERILMAAPNGRDSITGEQAFVLTIEDDRGRFPLDVIRKAS